MRKIEVSIGPLSEAFLANIARDLEATVEEAAERVIEATAQANFIADTLNAATEKQCDCPKCQARRNPNGNNPANRRRFNRN